MKKFLLCVLLLAGCVSPQEKKPVTRWSNKEIIFVLVDSGKTNNVAVLTGLRSDGVFVWKLNRSGFEYDAKTAKDDD